MLRAALLGRKEVFPEDAAPIIAESMLPLFDLSWNKSWTIALGYWNSCNWSHEGKEYSQVWCEKHWSMSRRVGEGPSLVGTGLDLAN